MEWNSIRIGFIRIGFRFNEFSCWNEVISNEAISKNCILKAATSIDGISKRAYFEGFRIFRLRSLDGSFYGSVGVHVMVKRRWVMSCFIVTATRHSTGRSVGHPLESSVGGFEIQWKSVVSLNECVTASNNGESRLLQTRFRINVQNIQFESNHQRWKKNKMVLSSFSFSI